MRGHVILSHGTGSGPQATKVSVLADTAEALGYSTERPDYRDCDALGEAASVAPRVARLVERIHAAPQPPILVGSSMGAFVSGLASLQAPCRALFLMALPVGLPGAEPQFDMARDVPSMLIHGFADELCPADAALAFADRVGMPALLVADGHRLSDHVATIDHQFRLFLEHLSA
ncbi:alpha/beta hydrolase [Oleiagrimonas soli]|uniref:Alpha/beta hydrolase n=1 Tax=Oleiagrimonas soli TaxID=1543381 RepID=A0A099CV69_9GAMM|nr:alpha/beta hydrolase [Oleiagrimonas soli]KGI77853.1 alpha/beta hydrolase [Oleiagrimonas soli]MBB6183803.1 pimeloyl-ACP methyl ester carboxylesterase [Oleiagrimonas soli]